MSETFKVGIIGCGAISRAYITNARKFPILEIKAVSDLMVERAEQRAQEFEIPKACSVDELLADPEIDVVVNLTIPAAHAEVDLKAIEAGKHVWSEKPLAVNRDEGQQVLEAAKKKGVRVGCAPDTFLGAGVQTARKLIDEGAIGRPVFCTAFLMGRGHESWHPSPEFYYQPGGGPMFDMGPYYLTALMNLLGPIDRVSGEATIAIPERTITSQPLYGKKITVTTPDHLAGTMRFASGCTGTIITSFATAHADRGADGHPIVIYGTEGTLRVPDPNGFDGTVQLRTLADKEWTDVPLTHNTGYGRSAGVADMAHAVRGNRPHRASMELAFAVLDAMQGVIDSSETGKHYDLVAKLERPAAVPTGLEPGAFDE